MDKWELKKEARKIIKENFWSVILSVGINILVIVLYALIFTFVFKNTESLLYNLLTIIYHLITIPLSFGVTRYLLKIVNKAKKSFKDIFYYYSHQIIDVIILSVIRSIAITVGIALCLFPGIIIYFMLAMADNILVEKELNAIDSIKSSIKIMKGHIWDYCNFIISFMGIPFLCLFLSTIIKNNIYVLIMLILSTLIIIPYLNVALKLYYRELKKLK